MINVEFGEKKPEFHYSTGVHLYAIHPEIVDGNKNVLIGEDTKAIDLYKVAMDICILLSNQPEPGPDEQNVGTYPVFGNPKHMKFIKKQMYDDGEFQLIGYLDKEDVEVVSKFLNEKTLDTMEGVQRYFETLDSSVKSELEMLLGKNVAQDLNGYLKEMVRFFSDCASMKREVVIFAFA